MYVAEYFQQGQCFPGQTGSMQIQPNFWHWFHQNYVPMMNDITWCILLVAMIVWKSDTILVSIKQLSFTEIGRRHLHECTQQHGRVQWWMPPSVQNHKKLVRDLYNKHTNDMEYGQMIDNRKGVGEYWQHSKWALEVEPENRPRIFQS